MATTSSQVKTVLDALSTRLALRAGLADAGECSSARVGQIPPCRIDARGAQRRAPMNVNLGSGNCRLSRLDDLRWRRLRRNALVIRPP